MGGPRSRPYRTIQIFRGKVVLLVIQQCRMPLELELVINAAVHTSAHVAMAVCFAPRLSDVVGLAHPE